MDIRKLQRAIVDGLEDVKGQNISVFNTEQLSPLFERVIIASGTSNRQTKALAASVRDAVKAGGFPVPRMEGQENGEWIIVDCGAAVAHIMQPAIRDYYHLEEIWGAKPVRMKLGSAPARADGQAAPPPAKKAASRVPAAKAAPAKKVARKKAAPKKAAAKKITAKKAPAKKPGVTRTTGTRSAPARAPAKEASAPRKAPAKR